MAQLQFITRAFFSTTHREHTEGRGAELVVERLGGQLFLDVPFPMVSLPFPPIETPNKSTETESKVGGVMCDGGREQQQEKEGG